MVDKPINLIRVKTESSTLELIEPIAKKLHIVAVAVLLVSGLVVGSANLLLSATNTRLTGTKSALTQSISSEKVKEGLLSSIKNRVSVVDKILTIKKPVKPMFDTVSALPIAGLKSITINEAGRVEIAVRTATFDEAVSISNALILLLGQSKLKDPELVSLSLGKEGEISISFAYIAVL